jgi:hypothetical protein
MAEWTLSKLLAEAGKRMALELKEQVVPHSGEAGSSREEIVRRYLRKYLPNRFEISDGFVFDINNNVSSQLDIIIADASLAPRYETGGGIRFYPCEAVVAVGEVKTHVTSGRELWQALLPLRSVTTLDRSANGSSVNLMSGEPLDPVNNHLDRIFTFVFIADRALDADRAREVLWKYTERAEPHTWPNLIFSLEKYTITYCCDDGVCPNTMHARGISKSLASPDENILRFYQYLLAAVNCTSTSPIPSHAHLKLSPHNVADVIFNLGSPDPDDEGASDQDRNVPPFLWKHSTEPWRSDYPDDE